MTRLYLVLPEWQEAGDPLDCLELITTDIDEAEEKAEEMNAQRTARWSYKYEVRVVSDD